MNEKVELYTIDKHCEGLLKILEDPQPCICCPASPDFTGDNHEFCRWENDQCNVCREFVDCKFLGGWSCPCLILGKSECIKRTWINLEEKGYI